METGKTKQKKSSPRTKAQKNKGAIVLCAGGSGGHMFPAEALAAELNKSGFETILFTDSRGTAFQGKKSQTKVCIIAGEAVAGRNLFRKAIAAFKLGFGTLQALFLLKKPSPKAVIGFGGFASVPGCIAALLLRIPVVLHEQNAVLGRANRLLAKRAKLIITSFAKTSLMPKGAAWKYVGMPVRPEIAALAGSPYPALKEKGKINILVVGGSQGAKILSKVVPSAFKLLPSTLQKRLNVMQQCRKEDLDDVRLAYAGSGIKTELDYFFSDIPEKMIKAHLIISRSGSSSMAEIFTIGRPAILIPYRFAADNHQYENALSLSERGGGWIINEEGITSSILSERLIGLFQNPDVLAQAASCALIKDVPAIAGLLAKEIITVAEGNKNKLKPKDNLKNDLKSNIKDNIKNKKGLK